MQFLSCFLVFNFLVHETVLLFLAVHERNGLRFAVSSESDSGLDSQVCMLMITTESIKLITF